MNKSKNLGFLLSRELRFKWLITGRMISQETLTSFTSKRRRVMNHDLFILFLFKPRSDLSFKGLIYRITKKKGN